MDFQGFFQGKQQAFIQKQIDKGCTICGRPLHWASPYDGDGERAFQEQDEWERQMGKHYYCFMESKMKNNPDEKLY